MGRNGSSNVTIDELDKDLVVMLKDLKVGQYSKPTEFVDERGRRGIRIVYLRSKTEPHRENLKDDYDKIAQRALEEKKNQELEKWFSKKVVTYYILVDDEFKSCPEMKRWLPATTASSK
jgi:peptidyl-prolyl cis-trans isomerase SurA